MVENEVDMHYVLIIQIWLMAHYNVNQAYHIWKESSDDLAWNIVDDYQLGQSKLWNEEIYNNAASFFDQYIEYLLGLRE